jgi:hypothetical protein
LPVWVVVDVLRNLHVDWVIPNWQVDGNPCLQLDDERLQVSDLLFVSANLSKKVKGDLVGRVHLVFKSLHVLGGGFQVDVELLFVFMQVADDRLESQVFNLDSLDECVALINLDVELIYVRLLLILMTLLLFYVFSHLTYLLVVVLRLLVNVPSLFIDMLQLLVDVVVLSLDGHAKGLDESVLLLVSFVSQFELLAKLLDLAFEVCTDVDTGLAQVDLFLKMRNFDFVVGQLVLLLLARSLELIDDLSVVDCALLREACVGRSHLLERGASLVFGRSLGW